MTDDAVDNLIENKATEFSMDQDLDFMGITLPSNTQTRVTKLEALLLERE